MARARNIKPGFFSNEELVELPFSTRLLFIGLWTLADREGRLEDKPKRIKMNLFPADSVDVDAALSELQASGFLTRYEVDGERFIQVLAFRKHQNPHRDEKASLIPPVGGHSASTVQAPESNGGNPADSLIPDPLPLNPDSPIPSEQPARADLPTAVQLSIAFNAAGIKTQPADPRLIALADQGVTVQTVEAACIEAKAAKPNEVIGLGYVAAILTRWAADASKIDAGRAVPPAERRATVRQGPVNEKFNFSHLDRSGDQRAMAESMQRHGITMPGPDEEIEI